MKKLILLVISLVILGGCTVEYNATLTKDDVIENVLINGTEYNVPTTAYIDDQGASETNEKIPGVEYYDIVNSNNSVKFKYTFPYDKYHLSRAVNYCYDNVTINEIKENSYFLYTSIKNACLNYYEDLEEIEINLNISSDFKVTKNNADMVNNNTYTWVINRNNYNNKSIELYYDLIEKDNKENRFNLLIIFASFIVLGAILTFIVKRGKK